MRAPHPSRSGDLSRRNFLHLLGASAIAVGLAGRSFAALADRTVTTAAGKQLRGIFPIAQTPFTAADALDIEALVKQLDFIARGGVQGFVWPQIASEWSTLSEAERLAGMEAIGHAGRKLPTAIVLGVQGSDMAAVRRYIAQAERVGADAIISLPPAEITDRAGILGYYQEIGRTSKLPLFVQAVGNVDVDLLLELYHTIPTMRYVKDEAGDPLERVGPLREKSHDEIKVFSGGHGRKLIDEQERGFSGSMPAASFADLYATTFDLWHAGKKDEARASHARTLEALTAMLRYGIEGLKYVLVARGVFTTYGTRKVTAPNFVAAQKLATGGAQIKPLDDAGKKELDALVASLKPYYKA
ncbi:MAG TPA: dihydrodipicolinate synthase family protein [Opitutaceae bacterium]|nr:dihydrodipicolinate synthase family protein [Opitutaceae bacterium]